jgi:hypothetical protein
MDEYQFANVLFTSWNFAITESETCINHGYAISTVFKTLLGNLEIQDKKKALTKNQYVENVLRRITGNVIVVSTFVVSYFLIYASFNEKVIDGFRSAGIGTFISPSVFLISILNLALPWLYEVIGRFEKYTSPAVQLQITLARSFVMKLASIYVVLVIFYIDYLNRKDLICWENAVGQYFYGLGKFPIAKK